MHSRFSSSLRLSVLGLGKVGSAIARHAHAMGIPLGSLITRRPRDGELHDLRLASAAITTRIEELDVLSTHVVIAAPDFCLPEIVSSLAPIVENTEVCVFHTSGLHSAQVLIQGGIPESRAGVIHPVQSFASDDLPFTALRGISCGITGSDAFIATALPLVEQMGWIPLRIREDDKPLYHAACVLSGNFSTTLLAESISLLGKAGVEPLAARHALARMLMRVAMAVMDEGPDAALTGPAARGDASAILAHLRALESVDSDLIALYREMTERTMVLARLPLEQRTKVIEMMRDSF